MTFDDLEKLAEECEFLLKKYAKNLEEQVQKSIHEAIDTNSAKTLRKLKTHIELNYGFNGELRFLLSNLEKIMKSLLKGIDEALISLDEQPTSTFYIPKEKEVREDTTCPYCRKINKKFTYGEFCKHCRKMISDPWKEKTICPMCLTQINSSQILGNKEAYEYDSKNNFITCENEDCLNRFDWKLHREEPKAFGLKICIACHMPFIPDKRNYKKQRVCSDCKVKGIDSHQIDNPNYQKKYREKMKKKKKVT